MSINSYFKTEYGLFNNSPAQQASLNSSKRSLKKRLSTLKSNNGSIDEIRAVSRALRPVMPTGQRSDFADIRSNSKQYKVNPWKFMNSCVSSTRIEPVFNMC